MNSDQLLAIGAALVKAVRQNIKYSANLYFLYNKKLKPFFEGREKKLNSIRTKLDHTSGFLEGSNSASAYPKQVLEQRVGYCSEVSEVATYLGSMLDQLEEPVYLSAIGATGHEFCLIHQSYELHQQTKRDIFIADDFKSLSEKKELVNAIIADPWIYKASKLSDYQEHIKSAHDFVGPLVYRSFYGKIRTKGYSEELGTARPNTLLEKKLLRDFNLAYQEE